MDWIALGTFEFFMKACSLREPGRGGCVVLILCYFLAFTLDGGEWGIFDLLHVWLESKCVRALYILLEPEEGGRIT